MKRIFFISVVLLLLAIGCGIGITMASAALRIEQPSLINKGALQNVRKSEKPDAEKAKVMGEVKLVPPKGDEMRVYCYFAGKVYTGGTTTVATIKVGDSSWKKAEVKNGIYLFTGLSDGLHEVKASTVLPSDGVSTISGNSFATIDITQEVGPEIIINMK